jgi:hypothetical protein
MQPMTLRYSERLVRAAVRSFVLRAVGREALMAAVCALVAAIAWLYGERGWGFGFLCGMMTVALVLPVIVFAEHYRRSIGTFRRMRSKEATLTYDENTFTLSSDLRSSTLPWSSIKQVWRFDEFWLLLLSRAQFMTLPLDGLDESTRDWIVRTVPKVN